jgi:transposase
MNQYVQHSRLSEADFFNLLKLFLEGADANLISNKIGVNRNTVNLYVRALRMRIAKYCEENRPTSFDNIKVSTSFKDTKSEPRFQVKKLVDKRSKKDRLWRVQKGKEPLDAWWLKRQPSHYVIGVLDGGTVWTAIVPKLDEAIRLFRYKKDTPRRHTPRKSQWNRWLAFDAVASYGSEKELKIMNLNVESEVKNFRKKLTSTLKTRRGVNDLNFYFHLKESEFRYNAKNNTEALDILKKELLKEPLSLTKTIRLSDSRLKRVSRQNP